MRFAVWTIEWMNDWFVPGGGPAAFRAHYNGPHGAIPDVAALAARVAACIEAMNPDVLLVIEGPSGNDEMELFVHNHLNANYSVLGGTSCCRSGWMRGRQSDSSMSIVSAALWSSA